MIVWTLCRFNAKCADLLPKKSIYTQLCMHIWCMQKAHMFQKSPICLKKKKDPYVPHPLSYLAFSSLYDANWVPISYINNNIDMWPYVSAVVVILCIGTAISLHTHSLHVSTLGITCTGTCSSLTMTNGFPGWKFRTATCSGRSPSMLETSV